MFLSPPHCGIWKLGDLELRVHKLDDGTAVIEAQDFKKALEWLGLTEADSDDEWCWCPGIKR